MSHASDTSRTHTDGRTDTPKGAGEGFEQARSRGSLDNMLAVGGWVGWVGEVRFLCQCYAHFFIRIIIAQVIQVKPHTCLFGFHCGARF